MVSTDDSKHQDDIGQALYGLMSFARYVCLSLFFACGNFLMLWLFKEHITSCAHSSLNVVLHHYFSRASKVFTNHQQVVQSGCLECFSEVSIFKGRCVITESSQLSLEGVGVWGGRGCHVRSHMLLCMRIS